MPDVPLALAANRFQTFGVIAALQPDGSNANHTQRDFAQNVDSVSLKTTTVQHMVFNFGFI
jgi:hypothetical protein